MIGWIKFNIKFMLIKDGIDLILVKNSWECKNLLWSTLHVTVHTIFEYEILIILYFYMLKEIIVING